MQTSRAFKQLTHRCEKNPRHEWRHTSSPSQPAAAVQILEMAANPEGDPMSKQESRNPNWKQTSRGEWTPYLDKNISRCSLLRHRKMHAAARRTCPAKSRWRMGVANIYAHATEYVETEQSNFPISVCLCIEPMYGEGNHIMTVSATYESGVDVRVTSTCSYAWIVSLTRCSDLGRPSCIDPPQSSPSNPVPKWISPPSSPSSTSPWERRQCFDLPKI